MLVDLHLLKYIRVVGIFQRAHATLWKMNSDSVEGKLIKLAFRTNSATLAALLRRFVIPRLGPRTRAYNLRLITQSHNNGLFIELPVEEEQ